MSTKTEMVDITYIPEVECEVSPGFLETESTVGVTNRQGNVQYLRVGKAFVRRAAGKAYLPVGIVELDYREKSALIELPQEADSGANRLWVQFSSFRQENGKS